MSSYRKITKHPETGEFEVADWIDDYFGNHRYGVQFPDGKIFPEDKYHWETKDLPYEGKQTLTYREEKKQLKTHVKTWALTFLIFTGIILSVKYQESLLPYLLIHFPTLSLLMYVCYKAVK